MNADRRAPFTLMLFFVAMLISKEQDYIVWLVLLCTVVRIQTSTTKSGFRLTFFVVFNNEDSLGCYLLLPTLFVIV